MPKIENWSNFPEGIRRHLIDRMLDRAISIADLNLLRLWIESKPEVPESDWYKDDHEDMVLLLCEVADLAGIENNTQDYGDLGFDPRFSGGQPLPTAASVSVIDACGYNAGWVRRSSTNGRFCRF